MGRKALSVGLSKAVSVLWMAQWSGRSAAVIAYVALPKANKAEIRQPHRSCCAVRREKSRTSSWRLHFFNKHGDNEDEIQGNKQDIDDDEPAPLLESLDVVLDKARKRSNPMLAYYRIQAFLDGPFWQVDGTNIMDSRTSKIVVAFSRADAVLVLVALAIDAPGFAGGWIVGKATFPLIRDALRPPAYVLILLQPFWPIVWAVALDQVL